MSENFASAKTLPQPSATHVFIACFGLSLPRGASAKLPQASATHVFFNKWKVSIVVKMMNNYQKSQGTLWNCWRLAKLIEFWSRRGLRVTKWDFSFRKPSATLPQSFRKETMNKKCCIAYAFLFAWHVRQTRSMQNARTSKGTVRIASMANWYQCRPSTTLPFCKLSANLNTPQTK